MGPNRFGPDPCSPKEVDSWDAQQSDAGFVATACDDWVCPSCGAQNFQQYQKRSA